MSYRCANCGAEADHPEDAHHMVECPDPAMFSTAQPVPGNSGGVEEKPIDLESASARELVTVAIQDATAGVFTPAEVADAVLNALLTGVRR